MLSTRIVAGATSGFVLSAVCATVLTVACFAEVFVEPLRVDPSRPAPITLRLPRSATRLHVETPTSDTYAEIPEMIPRGSVTREPHLSTVVRMYETERRPPRSTLLAAQWLVYFLMLLAAAAYMRRAGSDRSGLMRAQVSMFGLSLLFLLGAKALLLLTDLPEFLLPVPVIPLWAALLLDRRTGVALGLMLSLCTASLCSYDPIASATFVISTTAATLSFRKRKRASLLLVSGLVGGVLGAIVYVAAKEIYDGFLWEAEMHASLYAAPLTTTLAGLGAGLIAYVFHIPVARSLGIVSRNELLYLSDLEQPLLQRMATRAPGSWEHSRMMANLAEAAASSIGADALLTRVGAYYHDLGKSVQPKYFVENLRPGEDSPHENLDPDVSADAIMAHVVEGVRILREGRIPEAVIEFAYTHHGTSVIEYFWHKCKKQGNPKGLSDDAFRYPGMRPRTKETGILMLIDAIEAGARTVDPPTRKKFSELVRRVIFSKLQQGQLDEAGLSMEELRIVTTRITDSLCSAYHSRVRYPWQDEGAQRDATADDEERLPSNIATDPDDGGDRLSVYDEQHAPIPSVRAVALTDTQDPHAPSNGRDEHVNNTGRFESLKAKEASPEAHKSEAEAGDPPAKSASGQ